jgi:Mg2+ and Co2+ transporter CorA
MDFKMPETNPEYAYYIFIAIIATISFSMFIYFKKKKML